MASKDVQGDQSRAGPVKRLLLSILDKILLPFRIITSDFALKAYLTSILFFFTALVLFGFAVLAYILFYWSYIPRVGFSRTIHLQYDPIPIECSTYLAQLSDHPPPGRQGILSDLLGKDAGHDLALSSRCASSPSPWGTATISPDIISQQAYDVVIELRMPRTPSNLDAGNFMVDARLLSSIDTAEDFTNPFFSTTPQQDSTLARSRRPAIIPYRSPLLSLYETLLSLPRATLGLQTETSTLSIPLFSRVAFAKGKARVPTAVHVQLQTPSGHQLRVYQARLHFRARFSGLRWAMYNLRLPTAAAFVTAFLVAEAAAALTVCAALGLWSFAAAPAPQEGKKIKTEPETEGEMSDTERTFPSYGTQLAPLRFEGRGIKIKDEPGLETGPLTPGGGEADDEDDEDADFVLDDTGRWRDSGVGTSMDSGLERSSVRRRRSRGGSGTGTVAR